MASVYIPLNYSLKMAKELLAKAKILEGELITKGNKLYFFFEKDGHPYDIHTFIIQLLEKAGLIQHK